MGRGRVDRGRIAAAAALWVALAAGPARALEAFDGRLEAHGFGEIQVRALDREFQEELDLAQWYNIFNLEIEYDFAPDGLGPIDLLSAFVRAEFRYDCVYSRGCGMFRSVNTYGDRAERLPNRLSDASDPDYGGVIPPVGTGGAPRHPRPEPARVEPFRDSAGNLIKDSGLPGFDTLFRLKGPDSLSDTGDEPAEYTFGPILEHRFALHHTRDQAAGGTQILGPWLPKNEIDENGKLRDRANPLRRRFTPLGGERFHEHDFDNSVAGSDAQTLFDMLPQQLLAIANVDRGGPCLPPNGLVESPPGSGVFRCFRFDRPDGPADPNASPTFPVAEYFPSVINTIVNLNPLTVNASRSFVFGGDWNPTLPCLRPFQGGPPIARAGTAFAQQLGAPGSLGAGVFPSGAARPGGGEDTRFCIPDGQPDPADPFDFATGSGDPNAVLPGLGSNVRISGGSGELPLRPAPDLGNVGTLRRVDGALVRIDNSELSMAQGLYYPSAGLRRELAQGNLNDHDFDISESERSFNHGQAQKHDKELKEAYIDAEFLDSRLWARVGLQNIVWGKTELFRTTDQFNPQDLALASLPSLEESRIALWSARFVYSLYDVWDFDDVRLEFAVNWDEFQPADLGGCGEPFTPDVVCGVTFGLLAHGLLGVGIAGVDRPEKPWDNLSKGVEFGGRIEWRWNRFSFALTDFFGYSDFPHPDTIFTYDRNVDPRTGRMRIAGSAAPCGAGFATVTKQFSSYGAGAIGTDPDCLKPGGAAGFAGENRFVQAPDLDGDGAPDAGRIVDLPSRDLQGGDQIPDTGDGRLELALCDPGATALCIPVEFVANDGTVTQLDMNGDGTVDGSDLVLDADQDGVPDAFGVRQRLGLDFDFDGDGDLLIDADGDGERDLVLDVGAVGISPQNALEHHSANQTFWAVLCSATTGIAPGLDPTSCAFNIFTTPRRLSNLADFPPFSEVVSALAAGEQDEFFGAILRSIQDAQFQGDFVESGLGIPTVPINRDLTERLAGNRYRFLGVSQPQLITVGDGRPSFSQDEFSTSSPSVPNTTDFLGLDSTLSAEQKALFGCGPFFGTRCDSSAELNNPLTPELIFDEREGGGIDFLNTEASALVQSWPGFEGTQTPGLNGFRDGQRWTTTDIRLQQPGTVGPVTDPVTGAVVTNPDGTPRYRVFDGGPVCTRYVDGETVTLPGCRGIATPAELLAAGRDQPIETAPGELVVYFQPGYTPGVDGCIFDPSSGAVAGRTVRARYVDTGDPVPSFASHCGTFSHTRTGNQVSPATVITHAGTLYHKLAGCFDDPLTLVTAGGDDGSACAPRTVDEFGMGFLGLDPAGRVSQVFRSEVAAVSWNLLMLLVITSCNQVNDNLATTSGGLVDVRNVETGLDCFDSRVIDGIDRAYLSTRCSLQAPQLCRNVKGFLSIAGVQSNRVVAGGNGRFGRRTFAWHGGQEVVLRYERRNVFGFSMDFAEDVTKTNWGVEFTWIDGSPFFDRGAVDNITRQDTLNLTVSVDRPTFINFLNANRTFFFNSQWFFQYQTGYRETFSNNGPWNVLFTVAIMTGYYQDRLLPQLITVYDFNSRSGGFLPSIQYRFTDAFSVQWGMLIFIGRTQLKEMPINPIAPPANRAAPHAYQDPVENVLSVVRNRDEIFFRLRYTF